MESVASALGNIRRWRFASIDFADLDFARRQFLCKNSRGEEQLRWLRCGMPWISQNLIDTVIFLWGLNPKTKKWTLGGSGFLFGFPSDRAGPNHIYAVTNWHVAVAGGFSSIRLGCRSDLDLIEFEPHEWTYLANGDDLAVIDITDSIDPTRDEATVIDTEMALTESYAQQAEIGFGDDVFMIGLFANSPGDHRNAPVARFGNVARIPNDDALVEDEMGRLRPAYLVDMRSRTGFSGSPVFIYRTHTSDLRPLTAGGPLIISAEGSMFNLLGVHFGQYPESFQAEKSEAIGDPVSVGDKLKGPSAMNSVVPAWRLFEVLDDPHLKAIRAERDAKRRKNNRDRPVPESIQELPTNPDNPQGREDFNRLLDAAVSKKKRGPET